MVRSLRPASLAPWYLWLSVPLSVSGAHAASLPPAGCHMYQAIAGDTLIAIATRDLQQPSDWRTLARINRIAHPRRIPVGAALCLPLDRLKARPRPGVVLDVTGLVTQAPPSMGRLSTTAPDAPPREVHKGDAIPPGTRLHTGPNGYVTVQLPDGSLLKVQADTDARLDTSEEVEATGRFSSTWEVIRGRVESWVKPSQDGQRRHQIRTPHATLGVRGTVFRVATDETRTLGETLSGSVAVSGLRPRKPAKRLPSRHAPTDARMGADAPMAMHTLLTAGEGTVTVLGQMPQAASRLPDAPDVSSLPALHERVLLRWPLPATPGATAYRIQVAEDEAFQRVRGEATSPTPLLRLTNLPDGDYFLRARVADARGLESADAIGRFRLKARPEAPLPSTPQDGAKVRAHSATFAWASHPAAVQYRLQIARDAAFTQRVHEDLQLTGTNASVALAPGDYHWRVASTAINDDHGPWGDAQTLRMREPPAQPPQPQVSDTSLSFQLPASEPGQRFDFQLAADAGFVRVREALHSDSSHIDVARPQEGGLLYVRYRAIDADGFVGPWSVPQSIALPACVRSGDGTCARSGHGFITTQP